MKQLLIFFFFANLNLQAQNSSIIDLADEAALKNFDNKKALQILEEAIKLDSENPEILWRLSRAYVDLGEHLPTSTDAQKEEQIRFYQKSLDFAERAVKINSSNQILQSMSITRRAIALGRVALFKGVWESLDLVKKIKDDCEKAIKLDKTNATAFYVLARTHAKICEKPKLVRYPLGLSWANLDDAVKFFKKAIEIRPTFIMYKLDFARTLVDLDDFKNAKEQLYKIQYLPTEDEDDDQYRKEAKLLLEKIKSK
ncbi:MAG: tetratricopeptide repeat protein [Bacteroidota bacterium]